MIDIEVRHVERSVLGAEEIYVATVRVTNNGRSILWQHNIPVGTFESRAAEYGINPDDEGAWDDLLEMVFYENWVGDGDPVREAEDPEHLYNAPTIPLARKAKQRKLRTRRGKGTLRGTRGYTPGAISMDATAIENSGEDDPLEFIKRTAPMRREHMKVRAEYTRRTRNNVRSMREGARTYAEAISEADKQTRRDMKLHRRETAEELAARLLGDEAIPNADGEWHEPPSSLAPPRRG